MRCPWRQEITTGKLRPLNGSWTDKLFDHDNHDRHRPLFTHIYSWDHEKRKVKKCSRDRLHHQYVQVDPTILQGQGLNSSDEVSSSYRIYWPDDEYLIKLMQKHMSITSFHFKDKIAVDSMNGSKIRSTWALAQGYLKLAYCWYRFSQTHPRYLQYLPWISRLILTRRPEYGIVSEFSCTKYLPKARLLLHKTFKIILDPG